MTSTSDGCIVEASTGGMNSRIMSRERAASDELRSSFRMARFRLRSVNVASKYIAASTRPQAMLHPRAPMSMLRTSFRSAVATLNVPVNVSAMMRPKMTPETRSMGESTGAGIVGALAGRATEVAMWSIGCGR